MSSFTNFSTMFSTAHTSVRQLTPSTLASLTLPPTFRTLQPVWAEGTYRVCTDEAEYADMLTEVEDEDEIAAEEMEGMHDTVEDEERWDVLYCLDGLFDEAPEAEMQDEGEVDGEQQVCASLSFSSFFGGEVSVEVLFDVSTPFATDEELFVRSVFDAVAAPRAVHTVVEEEEGGEEVELVDTSELKLMPSVAVHRFCDPVAAWAEAEALPDEEGCEEEEVVVKREGRSLIPALSLLSETKLESVPELVLDTEATWTLQDDPVLRYVTAQTFLPGLEDLVDVDVCSAFIQYDNADIDALFQATTSFVEDRYDGECTCLDGKPNSLRLPGENYFLVANEDVFGLSVARPRAEDIFELLDAVVDDDDESDGDEDMLGGEFLYDDDEDLPRAGVFYDAAAGGMISFIALDQLLYPTTSIAEYPPSILSADSQTPDYELTDDEDHVSDMSESDAENLSTVQSCEQSYSDTDTQQPSELTYFDADSQQCVGYTAFNQLLQIDTDQMRPVIYRDFDDLFDQLVEEVKELLQDEVNELDETDLPPPQVQTLTRPPRPAFVQKRSRGFRRVGPYEMYSSHQRPTVRSRCNVQLVIQPQQLYDIDEDEEEDDHLSPPSSASSLDFTTHCAVVTTLTTRRANFLDDNDIESSIPSPTSQTTEPPRTASQYDHIFADAIWTTSPDLALTNTSPTSSSSSIHDHPPPPLLDAFTTELHNHLALLFTHLNTGRSHELPRLSNDLAWALDALAAEYPSMTLLASLGLAVEILVERMVASSVVT